MAAEKHQDTLWGLRPQAKKNSDIEKERERQESLWASGKEMDPTWCEALKREQEAIMNGIEVERKKKTGSALNGSHDAGLLHSSRSPGLLPPTPPATPPFWKFKHSRSKPVASKSVSKLGSSSKHETGGRSQLADSSSLLTAETSLRPSSSIRSHSSSTRPPSTSTRSPSSSLRSSSRASSRIPHRSEDVVLLHRTTTEDRSPGFTGWRTSFEEPNVVVQPPSPSLSSSPLIEEESTYEQPSHRLYPGPLSPASGFTRGSSQRWETISAQPHSSTERKRRRIASGESEARWQEEAQQQEEARRLKQEQNEGKLFVNQSRLEQNGQMSEASGTPKKKTFVSRLKDAIVLSPGEAKKIAVSNRETIDLDLHASDPAGDPEGDPEMQTLSTSASKSSSDIKILAKLAKILESKVLYKRLLSCSKPDVQTALEVFQMLLDTREMKGFRRRQLITAMRRLSKKTQLFPLCFNIYGPIHVRPNPSGGGRYADVYEARVRNEYQDERLCLKVIRAYPRSSAQHIAKIYAREAITWGQLYHPNVLPFYGLYEYRDRVSLVAPWAENGHLGDYLKRNPELNPVLLCSDAAIGLSYLHKHSVVHGDIKAPNVLIDHSGRACLGDLGLSSVTDPEIVHWTSESSVASKGGSTRYQAPELHEAEPNDTNKVHNSKASDVFAWACLCYEAFTGKIPFYDIQHTGRVINSIVHGKHPARPPAGDPAWTRRGLTTGIWMIMEDCWKKDPLERPHISMVIARLKSELPVDTRPPPQWQGRRAREFRYQQSEGFTHHQPTLEDLDVILSRILPE